MGVAKGGGGYDVCRGQFLYQGGTVCRVICGIKLQIAAGWRKCFGDVELICVVLEIALLEGGAIFSTTMKLNVF